MKRIFTTSMLLCLLGLSSVFAQIPTSGLVGYWPFNGNANDGSGNGNNGTVTGATLTTDRFGIANSAYSFSGSNQYISFAQTFIFNQSGDASISIWLNKGTLQNIQGTFLFSTSSTVDSNRFNFYFHNQNSKIVIDYRQPITLHQLNISNDFVNNLWQHIVYTRAGNIYNLYINGQLINSTTDASPNLPTSIGWIIGADPTSVRDFTSKIDDIRVYNRTLNETEVSELSNEGICYQTVTVTDTLKINLNTTGYSPMTYANTIKIYPNPTNDKIIIDNGNITNLTGYKLKITNTLGQQVYQTTITQQLYNVDLTTFGGKGIYFVNVINPQGTTIDIKKVVLQ